MLELATYNFWANKKITDSILLLSDEKQRQELPSSFKSIFQTTFHIWDAESIWWQRMKLSERIIIPSENQEGKMSDVVNGLLQQSQQWQDWVATASDIALGHVVQYHNSKKEYFKQPVFQILTHVFNHGTYHRGQLVNIFRQLRVEKIPQTDFIVFSRNRKKSVL